MNKKTLVLGASENPERYSFKATQMLLQKSHTVVPVGIRPGTISGIEIKTGKNLIEGIDTITLYVGPKNQPEWYDYLLSLKPKRIIFNPGTENEEFMEMAQKNGIEVVVACTLVMLSIGNF